MGYSLPDFQPNQSNFLAGLPLFHYQVARGSTRKKIHSHKSFEPLKVVSYHQGIYYPIFSQIEATFRYTVREMKNWLQNKLFYRSKPIRDLTQILAFWQLIAYR